MKHSEDFAFLDVVLAEIAKYWCNSAPEAIQIMSDQPNEPSDGPLYNCSSETIHRPPLVQTHSRQARIQKLSQSLLGFFKKKFPPQVYKMWMYVSHRNELAII